MNLYHKCIFGAVAIVLCGTVQSIKSAYSDIWNDSWKLQNMVAYSKPIDMRYTSNQQYNQYVYPVYVRHRN